jgi:conjugal transfer pilus assembly protein TraK
MITKRFLLMASCSLFVSLVNPAFSQDRIRSSSYAGDAVEQCYDWDTGFDYTHCERLPIPGEEGSMAQTYTLTDGSRRTLSSDPRTGQGGENVGDREGLNDLISAASNSRTQPDNSTNETTSEVAPEDTAQETPPSVTDSDAGREVTVVETARPTTRQEVEEVFEYPSVVPYIPGRSEIMYMANGHLNRIETPFPNPMVRTSADANALNIEFDQNFLYVSVTQPVTLFIHEKGHPDPAIVVSLIPKKIAPRQVKVTMPPNVMKQITANIEADQAEVKSGAKAVQSAEQQAQRPNSEGVRRTSPSALSVPANSIAGMIKTFAGGKLPRGFKQVGLENMAVSAFCRLPSGAQADFNQGAAIASNDYIIVRGTIHAKSNKETRLEETMCAQHPDTLGVAFSPRTHISSDHPTDFFVLIRRPGAPLQPARGE